MTTSETLGLAHVLLVDDDRPLLDTLAKGLGARGMRVTTAQSAEAALALLPTLDVDVVLTDVNMGGTSGITLCERATESFPELPVIVLTGFGSFDAAVAAIRAGAYDFLSKPARMDVIVIALRRALERRALRREVTRLRLETGESARAHGLIGESTAMRKVHDLVHRVGGSSVTVLVTGESGSGKEMVARALHERSGRRGPFVAINCAAVPEALLETELFGHARGAFADAREAREGLIQQARGGTLFLDEIGDMPLGLQPKLLRVLSDRVVRPVGAVHEVPVDVRVLSATNRDLEEEIEQKRFREDLYFRINVVQLRMPPLRARAADVLPLAQHFLSEVAARAGRDVRGLTEPAARRLLAYDWPGNVRELRNCIERAVALTRHELIGLDDLPDKIRDFSADAPGPAVSHPDDLCTLEEMERRYVLRVLEVCGRNKSLAARRLGIERKTLYRKLDQWTALDPPEEPSVG